MTTTTSETKPPSPHATATLSRVAARFLHALDDLVASRAHRAVPEWQLRRIEREIDHYGHLMHTDESNHPN